MSLTQDGLPEGPQSTLNELRNFFMWAGEVRASLKALDGNVKRLHDDFQSVWEEISDLRGKVETVRNRCDQVSGQKVGPEAIDNLKERLDRLEKVLEGVSQAEIGRLFDDIHTLKTNRAVSIGKASVWAVIISAALTMAFHLLRAKISKLLGL